MTAKEKCHLADQYYEQGRYQEAISLYQESLNEGYSLAGFGLGECYYGHDVEKAAYYYRFAALAGDAKAQNNLGVCYHELGYPTEAFKWYQKAAAQDLAVAYFSIGYMYEHGEGVPLNIAQAIYSYKKGASLGDSNAMLSLGWIYSMGEVVPENKAEARKWFTMARNAGNKAASQALAQMGY